ncbi:MAG: hypothetical protein CVU57_16980 [Deltaproteobacteria bacterium HGW-Deltaproteobacteria-15]|jgi:hypothetical protein|nr:MAG: hypothetical protein CVU57_16980 [Deltaproteobacteria bacterium HGW-Deltaproteobacteria-15]
MKPSSIITLLTDFGLSDPYVAMMKGVILSINAGARTVDITHDISPGAIYRAATVIRETYRFFPAGTIHVGVVDPGVGSDRRMIALEANGHVFVGPDNGLFWLILQEATDARVVHLTEKRFFLSSVSSTFHGRDVFAPVAAHLSLGMALENAGVLITDPTPLLSPIPRLERNALVGQITHVDHFGNLISNVGAETLHRFLGPSRPLIQVGTLTIGRLDRIYSDVEEGMPLAFLNSSDLLEVAVNLGRASEVVGVEKEDLIGTPVRISKAS